MKNTLQSPSRMQLEDSLSCPLVLRRQGPKCLKSVSRTHGLQGMGTNHRQINQVIQQRY
jgi:hypothetical protein